MPPLMTAMQHIAATLAPPPEPPPVAPVLPSTDTRQTAGPGTMKILVVDDHPLVLQALKGVLTSSTRKSTSSTHRPPTARASSCARIPTPT